MIYVIAIENQTSFARELGSFDQTDLNVCPEDARSADFLQAMDGWL